MKWVMEMNKREPLVFGDPSAPMTIGTFVRWLEEQFDPHDLRDAEQSRSIAEVNVAILGNGDPTKGIKHKVESMWDIAQKADAYMDFTKRIWRIVLGVLGGVATITVIGHNVGWW